MLDAIVEYERGGYTFIAMSESWKRLCEDVPDSLRIRFPGYATEIIDTEINGQKCVVQAWKGFCLELPGLPGGFGGEVGLYKRQPGRPLPKKFTYPTVFGPIAQWAAEHVLDDVLAVADYDTEIWWPTKKLDAAITMKITNPSRNDEPLLVADPIEAAGGYWMSRWMKDTSYLRYAEAGRVPPTPTGYDVSFTVGDIAFEWKGDGKIVRKG